MHDQPGAHAARLQGHVQRAADQAIVLQVARRIADRHHLGMGAGIMGGDRAVEAAADDLAAHHQHRPHRHLAEGRALGGQRQRLAHEALVVAAVDDHRFLHGEKAAGEGKPASLGKAGAESSPHGPKPHTERRAMKWTPPS
ncbi:hypothetical protein D3C81_1309940 [compost metagenome]